MADRLSSAECTKCKELAVNAYLDGKSTGLDAQSSACATKTTTGRYYAIQAANNKGAYQNVRVCEHSFRLEVKIYDISLKCRFVKESKSLTCSPSLGMDTAERTRSWNNRDPANVSEHDSDAHRIRIMTWNIDGLDPKNLDARTEGVCETITTENPHVVFLQEVIERSERIISENCPTYRLISGDGKIEKYYTAIMVRTDFVEVEDRVIMPFRTSLMGRNILAIKCKIKREKFYLMTSHLESMREHSKERVNQLERAFEHMFKADPDRTVIFGGDLNLRDKELSAIGRLPDGISDVWEILGNQPETKYTWDMAANDNLLWAQTQTFKPKLRFDRLYLKHPAEQAVVEPVCFELAGKERQKSCQRFPSDHWAILSHFNILSKLPN